MSSIHATEGGRLMSAENMFRADFRPVAATTLSEQTGRVESFSATGCTILTRSHPDPGAELELRLYLPGSSWPLRVDRAKVAWGHWDSFTVEFLSLPASEQNRLEESLVEVATSERDSLGKIPHGDTDEEVLPKEATYKIPIVRRVCGGESSGHRAHLNHRPEGPVRHCIVSTPCPLMLDLPKDK